MTWTIQPRSKVGDLSAIVAGEGPDVLLLHGVGLCAEAWDAQVKALSAVARVTAPDMPGHGDSPLTVAVPELAAYADVAQSVLEGLNGPALVVGHSMGAMLALELAHRLPTRVRGVVALNAVFQRPDEAARAVQDRAAALDGVTVADPTSTLRRWFGAEQTPERVACERWLCSIDPNAYKMAYTAFAHSTVPSRETLTDLTCPALFMTGAQEPNSTPEMSRKMADLAPNGRAHIVPGAAHMMPMTHPTPVNTALQGMLAEVFS